MENFSDKLKAAHKKLKQKDPKGFSFRNLSKKIGISAGALSHYESRKNSPSLTVLKSLCQHLGLDFHEMKSLLERQRAIVSEHLQNARYPELRKILLGLYNDEYSRLTKGFSKKSQISKEWEAYPLHFVEEKLLTVIYKELKNKDLLKKSDNRDNPTDTINSIPDQKKKLLIENVITDWAYNALSRYILVSFDIKKGESISKTFSINFNWAEKQMKK